MELLEVITPIARIIEVPVNAVTMEQALDMVDQAILGRKRLQIGVVNAAKIVNMQRDATLRDDVLSSDIILADGASVVLAGRLLRQPLPERVTGIDLMMNILSIGNEKGYRVFCLGATEEVLGKVVEKISSCYPNVKVVGRRNGYFTEEEAEDVAIEIAVSGADVLFVAMTSPRKEKFLARWSADMKVPVCHGVGGSFDVMAGKVDRAPEIWQKLGIEWLYRIKQEPRRLWRRYLVTNTIFCALVLREIGRNLLRNGFHTESR